MCRSHYWFVFSFATKSWSPPPPPPSVFCDIHGLYMFSHFQCNRVWASLKSKLVNEPKGKAALSKILLVSTCIVINSGSTLGISFPINLIKESLQETNNCTGQYTAKQSNISPLAYIFQSTILLQEGWGYIQRAFCVSKLVWFTINWKEFCISESSTYE